MSVGIEDHGGTVLDTECCPSGTPLCQDGVEYIISCLQSVSSTYSQEFVLTTG